MYPESDLYPIKTTKEMLKELELPELLDTKIKRITKQYNTQEHLVKEALRNFDIEEYFRRYKNLKPAFILSVLVEKPKEAKTRFNAEKDALYAIDKLEEKHFEVVLQILNEGKVQKEAVLYLLREIAVNQKINLQNYSSISDKEIEEEVKKILKQNKGASFNAIMGLAMKQFQAKVDSKKVVELIKKYQSD